MKRFLKVFVPIILSLTIILGIAWYLLFYDPIFTQDVFLSGARHFAEADNPTVSAWLYDRAYNQKQDIEEISIELADQYVLAGNYTKAEVALTRAIRDGAGAPVYIRLSQLFIEQDKLLDAIELLDKLPDSPVKEELSGMRPEAPTSPQPQNLYNQYIDVTVESPGNTLYVNPNGQYPSVHTDLYSAPITLTDGENLLYAVSVSDAGLASPLTVLSYTVGGIIQDMEFADSIIEKEVRSILGFSDGHTISTKDMWSIKTFSIPAHTKSFADLQHMINLEELTVENGVPGQLSAISEITTLKKLTIKNVNINTEDMEAIGCLTGLTELTLEGCGISSIASLSTLTELTILNLNNNAIRNISAISSLTKVDQLNLQRNVVVDVSPLASCVFLKKLNLSYNTIEDITSLFTLSLLTQLDISHNQIADVTAISKLTDLTELYANNNQIADITGLTPCIKLKDVNISNNAITSLEALKDHLQIMTLNFSNNQVAQLPAWSKTSKLVTLDGSYNKISDLTPLAGHENINNILMDYNENISSVDMLADCHVLIVVNVYGTKVKEAKALTDQDIIVNLTPV